MGSDDPQLSARIGRHWRATTRWARLLVPRRHRPGVRVFFGHDRLPAPGEPARGGTAKFQRLASRFANHPIDYSLLYLGSTWLPRDLRPLLALTRRRRIPVVVNQNGVAYPAWAGAASEALNRPQRLALQAADHVLYQSEFCKQSADRFLGKPRGSWEILYNAVDIERFSPGDRPVSRPPDEGPVLLLGGDQLHAYRLELALRTVAHLAIDHPGVRLLVTGRLVSAPHPLVSELGIADRVELVGRYAQSDAPALFRRADVLLHTKVNDPCPSVVIEAMACGLPIVYAASGGTVELVGDEAGVGAPHPESWERQQPPEPEALAQGVRTVLAEHERYRAAARARAVERFALSSWLDRHAALFAELTGGGATGY